MASVRPLWGPLRVRPPKKRPPSPNDPVGQRKEVSFDFEKLVGEAAPATGDLREVLERKKVAASLAQLQLPPLPLGLEHPLRVLRLPPEEDLEDIDEGGRYHREEKRAPRDTPLPPGRVWH